MIYAFSSFKDDAGGALGRETQLHPFARGLLLYIMPTIALFAVDAIGLWRVPGTFSGMYGNDDGIWAAWNLQGIFQWGLPFDLAPFNPLSGMGSTFLPNTPWLNPAALALALPFPREVCYLISYFVYFAELSASLILLFRVIGLRPLEAILCVQLYLLILFPPMNAFFGTLMWYSLAPVNAHLAAICNVLLVLVLAIGRCRFWGNIACGAGILFLLLCGIFSAPMTFLTYAPAYSVAGVGLMLGSKLNIKELGWKLATVLIAGLLLWLAGVNDYLQGTALISSRAIFYPAPFAAGKDLLTSTYWSQAWLGFDTCSQPLLLCPRFPIFYLHIGSLAGAALCTFERTKLRFLALAMLFFFTFVHVFDFASRVSLFGPIHVISPAFLIWSAYPFLVLFLGLLIFRGLPLIQRSLLAVLHPLRSSQWELKSGTSTIVAASLTLAIPAVALADWEFRSKSYQPPPPEHNPNIAFLGRSAVRHAEIGPITRYLIDHARIVPGAQFRGYTTTYLADSQGPLAQRLPKSFASGVGTYIAARYFFDRYYRNRLIETDLWEENIPTLEEYGQWVTTQVNLAVDMLFSPIAEPNSQSSRLNPGAFLHLFRVDLDLLPFLGVRYLITDLELHDLRLVTRAEQSADGAPTIFLYEIADANLGTWSPTKVVVTHSFDEAIALLRKRELDLSKTAVVFEAIEGTLIPARNVSFRFIRGGFHVTADATGDAAILLPVQYSRCWRLARSRRPDDGLGPALYRANGLQTLVTFSGHLDAEFRFAFGRVGHFGCRLQDVADLKQLGVN
jgi:hypothetical protein